jgi:adenylyltransferase/sulfurtransferase
MKSITASELSQLLNTNADLQLIDVREPHEHDEFDIGGELIPLDDIMRNAGRIEKDKPVIVYCRKGIRSHIAIQRLQNKFSFQNLVNLTGGLEDWKKQFPL